MSHHGENESIEHAIKYIDEEVLTRSPYHWRAIIGKAEALAKLKKWKEARQALDDVLEINPWSGTDKNFHYMVRFYDDKIKHDEVGEKLKETLKEKEEEVNSK